MSIHTPIQYLSVGAYTYSYRQYGEGQYPVLFFHGVNQSSIEFADLLSALPNCQVYSIDLPFHGDTQFNNEHWTENDLLTLFDAVLKLSGKTKLALAGFSIGAKAILKLVELLPAEKISRLYLLAPDGIHINNVYKFATRNAVGRKFFNHYLSRPQLLKNLTTSFHRLHIIPRGVRKMIENTLNKEDHILRIRKIWMSTTLLTPDLKVIIEKINEQHIPTYIYVGTRDSIIPIDKIRKFYNQLKIPQTGFFELDLGHNFAQRKVVPLIISTLDPKPLSSS